jgi:hypothetical protein
VEPARYDRARAQRILDMHRRESSPPDRSYYFGLDYFGLGLSVDANFRGTNSTPPIVLLNFVYGVAAYQRWQSRSGIGIIEKYFKDHYEYIPVPPRRAPSSERESSFSEQDDLEKDPTYREKGRHTEGRKDRHHTSAREKAMDDVNLVFMFLRGITPEEAAIRREERLKEEERMAQEAGRRKVMEWIDTNRT